LPEINLLAQDTDERAPVQLANALWYKYRTSEEWSSKVWDNTVASLRQISTLNFNPAVCRNYAQRYADLLSGVDQRLPHGLDDHVLGWLLGPGTAELHTLNRDMWLIFVPTLVNLVVMDAISTTTLLQGLIYPAWGAAASVASQGDAETISTYLSPATNLFELLLLRDRVTPEDDQDICVDSLMSLQRIVTRRGSVFSQEYFPSLVAAIPTLVLLEHNLNLSDAIRTRIGVIRSRLCQHHDFKQAVYRDLDQVRTLFERPLETDGSPGYLRESLVVALRLALDDGSPSPSLPTSVFGISLTLMPQPRHRRLPLPLNGSPSRLC
jgi:mediator of RNA polymerase II transcription subunit 12